ncbi:hypothetical protein F5B22DRAFT_159517 [Xylaria bambusicola]|uniref:uncharacterized protein n=1 Tax=Xylaria bambusicola TaxID=326684 RepID=UPI0020081A28|nr:uncharacterized protein F5B22DRAFT_159517 [Xylaria bambusicola]KAI0526473.1 hypothetical protein F5B22DRAFT_159517 [Xylaria bambusicola]
MLSFRSRTGRSHSGSLDSHASLPPAATISSFRRIRRKPMHSSINKNSLRGRLKGITENFTGKRRSKRKGAQMPYKLDPWYTLEPNDDLLRPVSTNIQHVEMAGQTWPAIRKSISSMASSLRTNHNSVGLSSPEGPSHQSSTRQSKISFRASQRHARRWVTMTTRAPPVAFRQPTSRARRSSFSTISEIVSRQQYESVPQLPKLAESSNFLDSLSRTGLFRLFTPPSEFNLAGGIKVHNVTALNGESAAGYARPSVYRLPLRLKNSDLLYQKAISQAVGNKIRGRGDSSQVRPPENRSSRIHHENKPPHQQHRLTPGEDKHQTPFCSRHPVEWLDRILETSYATRNPISPKLCVSKETMAFLCRNKTCFFVEFPRDRNAPEPLRCYPGFKAALEDICDRFGDFYAPFAAYNAVTRMITLYAPETPRPKNKFIDNDTALFDLERARSAWVKPSATYSWSSRTTTKSTSHDTSEDLTESSDQSRASTEETAATDIEDYCKEENEEKRKGLDKIGTEAPPKPSFMVDNGKDEEDVVDEEMASRLNFMG